VSRRIPGVVLLALALFLTTSPPVSAVGEPWDGLELLGQILGEAGYSVRSISTLPEDTVAGPVLLVDPFPDPDLVDGVWEYVLEGGSVVLPLEVPVETDDPLLDVIDAGGRKVIDRKNSYRGNLNVLWALAPRLTAAGDQDRLNIVLNMPTALAGFETSDPAVEVTVYRYPPSAYLARATAVPSGGATETETGHAPDEALVLAITVRTPADGRAVVIADFSLLTNQMITLADNQVFLLSCLAWAGGEETGEVYYLSPADAAPIGSSPGSADSSSSDVDEETGAAAGQTDIPQSWWDMVLLPLALLPLAAAWHRGRLPLHERQAETSFGDLVRRTAVSQDYRLPARQLRSETLRILDRLMGSKTGRPIQTGDGRPALAGQLSAYAGECTRLYAERHPGLGRLALWSYRRRANRVLRQLDHLARSGAPVRARRFVRAYLNTQNLLREIGGTHLYGHGATRRSRGHQ